MSLAAASLLLGIALTAAHVPLMLFPRFVGRVAIRFPRHRIWGWALAAVDLIWAAWLLNEVPLGRFEILKDYLFVLTPLAFLLVVCLVDELLAARALGGLLVLVPAPLLDMARWHPASLRLVVVGVAYLLAVAGIVLLLSPYWFRKTLQSVSARTVLCRGIGGLGCALGLVLVVLALAVF